MILVLSHAWCLDADHHADAYVRLTDHFGEYHSERPGFRGRRLVRDSVDRTHFINLRWWDRAEDYESMIHDPVYAEWIERLSAHVQPRDPEKMILEVVVDHADPATH